MLRGDQDLIRKLEELQQDYVALATTDEARAAAVAGVAKLDSLYGNNYAAQTPLTPRAAMQLAALPLLQRSGRAQEALARLATVPEDFGFNIAYAAEVHRRRAELLDGLGQRARAAAERARAAQIVR